MIKYNEVHYEIEYYPTSMAKRVSNIMSSLDLGIERISNTEIFILTTKTKITKSYIDKTKKILYTAFKSADAEIINIKFIKHKKVLINN